MKKFLLLTGLMVASVLTSQAQTVEEPQSIREIGFGTNLILGPIFNSSSIPMDFIYKWGNSNSLFRVGTSLYYSNSTDFGGHGYDYVYSRQNAGIELFMGREWRLHLAERWQLNYGTDVNVNYGYYSFNVEDSHFEGDLLRFSVEERNSYGSGVRPFIGVLFEVKPRFVIGTEASFHVGVLRFFNEKTDYFVENGTINKEDYSFHDTEADGWNFHFRTQPASNIFVYYRF